MIENQQQQADFDPDDYSIIVLPVGEYYFIFCAVLVIGGVIGFVSGFYVFWRWLNV